MCMANKEERFYLQYKEVQVIIQSDINQSFLHQGKIV